VEQGFGDRADAFYWAHLDFRPQQAIGLGHHRYDGRVPDRSAQAIASEIDRLREGIEWLEETDPAALSFEEQLDRDVLLAEARRALFELVDLRRPFRHPIFYLLFDFSLSPYIDRDYAPVDDRARGLLSACRGAPAYYQQMLDNLDSSLARPAVQVGLMMTGGAISFADGILRASLPDADPSLRADIDACLTDLVDSLRGVEVALTERMAAATDEFAIGEDMFLRMLAETQGFGVDLATLERIGRDDLERNLAAIEAAARQIDPDGDVREVIERVSSDKPDPGRVLAEATEQMAAMRAFVVDNAIASIPSDEQAEVRASPPHRRGNFASLSSAGPFETRELPSFYYLAPPDPSWPEEQQRAYLPSRSDLLFVTIHEVWPGHFLQGRHIKAHGSEILQSFETYSTSEGWAHYVEEMMWDAGVGDGDPRAHIGQLKNALLRNVRFLVAIGMHTRGMTVEEATTMFLDKAFADPQNARQQALRGTADPMYLSYTLGKIAIQKLRADYESSEGGAYTLLRFHDAFLRHGEAPIPAIRRHMLGFDAGPAL
jgi:uncharacterized protein (DUF885 family)